MKIIFLGAPGVGKGTQADLLSKKLGIPTISTGAIIREAIKCGTELGVKAEKFIKKGQLVDDGTVISIIKERLMKSDCTNGFILDGFPRTVPQAAALEDMGVSIDTVISIEVPDEEICNRMSGRRVCSTCGASYHLTHNPAKDGKSCDHCGTELSIRADDAPDVVRARLAVYHKETEPLVSYYLERGKLKSVSALGNVETVRSLIEKALGV